MSGSFTGQDGSTWAYSLARGDLPINGSAPTLSKAANAYVRSGTIAGGLGTLQLKYRKAYSTALDCQVYVNDSLVGTIAGGDGTTQTWSSASINVSGNVVLLFTNKSTSGQITIDDVQWTGYSSGGGTDPIVEIVVLPTNATEHLSLELSTSQVGSQYVLEYTTNLLENPLVFIQAAPGVNGTGNAITLQDPTNAPVGDGRFYRILKY